MLFRYYPSYTQTYRCGSDARPSTARYNFELHGQSGQSGQSFKSNEQRLLHTDRAIFPVNPTTSSSISDWLHRSKTRRAGGVGTRRVLKFLHNVERHVDERSRETVGDPPPAKDYLGRRDQIDRHLPVSRQNGHRHALLYCLRVSFFIIWIKWNRFFLKSLRNTKLNFNFIRKLSLSSNNIERIANLGSMKHLKILSLGRNSIKSIAGIVIMI